MSGRERPALDAARVPRWFWFVTGVAAGVVGAYIFPVCG